MKLRLNKNTPGVFSLATLLALLLVPLFFSGCNSGLGVLTYLLDDDEEENLTAAEGVSVVFEGFEDDSNRKDPRAAVLRFRLRSDSGGLANANISWSLDGLAFSPMTFVDPTPQGFELAEGEVFADDPLDYPVELRGLKTSRGGKLHRIGWNAHEDLGDSNLRQVTLRFESGDSQGQDVVVEIGNTAPVVESIQSGGSGSGLLRMTVTISDASSDSVDVAMEVSAVTENPAPEDWVQMRTAQSQRALASSPDGVAHQFDWLAAEAVGNIDGAVLVRMTPRDQVGEFTEAVGETVTEFIILELNEAPTVNVLGVAPASEDDFGGGNLAIEFRGQDSEGDKIDVILQWAHEDDVFPDLPEELEADPAARRELVSAPGMSAERSRLRIATMVKDLVKGTVELPGTAGLSANELLATWVLRKGELRALGEMSRRPVELLRQGGQEAEDRLVCSYSPVSGIMTLVAPFSPPAEPGDTLQVDLAASLNIDASRAGEDYRVIWASDVDVPGGGDVKIRITPYDRIRGKVDGSQGCAGDAADAGLAPGNMGTPGILHFTVPASIGFTPEPAWLAPLAEIDDPVAVAAGDIDGDGMLDLAAASRGARSMVLSFQRASGTFDQSRLLDDRIGEPADLELADLDGDGDLDAVIATSHFHTPAFPDEEVPPIEKAGSLMIFFQSDDPDPMRRFITDRASLKANGVFLDPTALAVADFDGDGDQDIAVSEGVGMDTALTIFYRGDNGVQGCAGQEGDYSYCTFSGPDVAGGLQGEDAGITDLASGDVDGDGDVDIIASALSGWIVFENVGAAGFQAGGLILAQGARIRSVGTIDLDHDGRLDFLAVDRGAGRIFIAWQLEAGGFEVEPFAPEGLERPVSLLVADLTLNGSNDLLVADSGLDNGTGGHVLVCLADASGLSGCEMLKRSDQKTTPQHVAVGDFDGDGKLDVASVDEGSRDVAIYQQAPQTALGNPAQTLAELPAGSRPSSFTVADLDADGDLDLAVVSPFSSRLTLLRRGENSNYSSQGLNLFSGGSSTRGASQVISADLDGDGRVDLVTANADTDNLLVLLQDSQGRFTNRRSVLSMEGGLDGVRSLAAGDIDGDGRLDLVAAGGFSDDLAWFRQVTGGVFAPPVSIDTGGLLKDPLQLLAEDINRDGMIDLLATGNESDNVVLFIQRADREAFFLYNLALAEGSGPVALTCGDLSGDSMPDIAVASMVGISIFEQAEGDFTETRISTSGSESSPTGLLAVDFNGNGRLDLLLANALPPGGIEIFSERGGAGFTRSQVISGDNVQTAGGSFLPSAMAQVDLNGDGEKDFVVANRSGDEMTVFWGGRR